MRVLFLSLSFTLTIFIWSSAASAVEKEVVVYTALDQIFSEPILQEFEKRHNITVKAVYDIEAVKSTGLVNRLIAEKQHPRCDVFWNNEILRTIVLKRKGVLTPYISPSAEDIPRQYQDQDHYWTAFAARARVIAANTSKFAPAQKPKSILDFIDPGNTSPKAVAHPLFGTTTTHMAALYAIWGADKAREYLKNIPKNKVRVVDGNSVVRDLAGSGEIHFGLTDTDDVNVGITEGMSIEQIFPDQDSFGTLLIPNSVALVKDSPNPEAGRLLIDFLLSPEVEKRLAASQSAQIPVRKKLRDELGLSLDEVKFMDVSYEKMADLMDQVLIDLQNIFLK